jgi:hypothetical protein
LKWTYVNYIILQYNIIITKDGFWRHLFFFSKTCSKTKLCQLQIWFILLRIKFTTFCFTFFAFFFYINDFLVILDPFFCFYVTFFKYYSFFAVKHFAVHYWSVWRSPLILPNPVPIKITIVKTFLEFKKRLPLIALRCKMDPNNNIVF